MSNFEDANNSQVFSNFKAEDADEADKEDNDEDEDKVQPLQEVVLPS